MGATSDVLTVMPPALFIVFNVGSGDGDADAVRAAIDSACGVAGRECHLLAVHHPRHLDDVAREAVTRAKRAKGIVVAAGGDGTINAVAQATLDSGCTFGVLPQGTFNYFSRTHGIPADVAQGMQVLLQESAQPVQVGLVNDRVFLVNASLGLYPQLLQDRETWKAQFGRNRFVAWSAGLATVLRGYRSLRLTIEVHGESREVKTLTLFVGNNALQMDQAGFPEAQAIDAGELAGITLRPMGRVTMLWLLLRGALGKLGESEQVANFSFKRLIVRRASGFGRRRAKVAVDGEIVWLTLPLEFRVSPQPLLLLRPAAPPPERTAA